MSKGPVNIEAILDEQHFTQPPPRYSEASLVKKLEELGIGRPSTYASIISVITTRGYAETISKRFHPTDRGKLISAFLEKLFSKYVDYNFTAGLEDQLDNITSGKEGWLKVLNEFWKDFNQNVTSVKEKRTREVLDLLNDSLGSLIFERDEKGNIDFKFNPNGSINNIAAILNKNKNILGMMPHPERMADKILSGEDGLGLFLSLMN